MSIKSDSAAGYARYLESKTVAPERGDYYLGPTSEAAQAPGRWHVDQATLERLASSLTARWTAVISSR